MDRRKLQLALMNRGIRVGDDDPLFIVTEANELHFQELVERHFKGLDQHVIARTVALAMTKYSENQQHKATLNCVVTPNFEKSVARLESTIQMLSSFEDCMTDAARAVAGRASREVAGQMLTKLAQDVGTGLARFSSVKLEEVANTVEGSAQTAMRASSQIRAAVQRAEAWWVGFAGLLVLVLFIGMYLGHQTTTGAYERVQAACTASKATR